MRVDLVVLEKVAQATFKHMKELGIEHVELEMDYYWNIPSEEKYDPYNKPADLNLGQLSDDWQDIVDIAENRNDSLGCDLVRLSSILRYIGEKHPA